MIQYFNDLKRLVEKNYDITVLNILKYKNVYKIIGVEGDFCLKQFKYDFYRLKHVLEVFKYLIDENFENVLDIIPAFSGEKYVELNNIYFYMTKWIESRELNYSNTYDIIRASQHIAKFHNYSEGFVPNYKIEADIRWGKWIDIFNKKINDILKFKQIIEEKNEKSIFDKIYLKNLDENIKLGNQSIENLKKYNYENIISEHENKGYICHHDLANHNILIDCHNKIYFIDFDYVILDSFLHDLSSFINRVLKYGRWTTDKFNIIIDSYKDVKDISKNEISLALSFMLFPNDFWQLGIQYYYENITWTSEKFLKRLTRFENDKKSKNEFILNMISN